MEMSNALASSNIKSKRELVIPHKRGLLPVSTSTSTSPSTTKVHKTINPSAVPAIIQLQRPVFSSLKGTTEKEKEKENEECKRKRYTTTLDDDDDDEDTNKVIRVEFDSSQAPQPFLEPEFAQRIMEARRHRKRMEEASERDEERALTAGLNTEREVRRRAAQTDYGSMAIRDRMTVSGRGRRRR